MKPSRAIINAEGWQNLLGFAEETLPYRVSFLGMAMAQRRCSTIGISYLGTARCLWVSNLSLSARHGRRTGQPPTGAPLAKSRHTIIGAPRQFLLDDCIHVLDSLCCYGGEPDGELHVPRRSSEQPELLAGASVAWQSGADGGERQHERSAGMTEERIDAYGDNLSLHIENAPWHPLRETTQCRLWLRTTGSPCWRAEALSPCSSTGMGRLTSGGQTGRWSRAT